MPRILLILAVWAVATGCSQPKANTAPVVQHHIDGEIVRLNPDEQSAVIKHKDIDGWMKAMTMGYAIRDKGDFAKLHPGDHITGTVFVQGDEFWVGDIHDESAAK